MFFLVMLGLAFSFSLHILPVDSRLSLNSQGNDSVKQIQQGKTLYQSGRFAEAAESLKQAAQTYRSQGDTLNLALALNYLSLTEQKLGRWNQATEAITASLNLLNKSPNTNNSKHVLALALNTQGSLQLALGQAEKALESSQKATDLYVEMSDRTGKLGSLINQASALQSLGFYRRANKIFDEIKWSVEGEPNLNLKLSGLQSWGRAMLASGNLKDAQNVLLQSLVIAQQLQLPQEESVTLLSLANTTFALAKRSLLQDTESDHGLLLQRCNTTQISDGVKTEYKKAVAQYDQIVNKSTSKITIIQAQLNRLNILQELIQKPTAEELTRIKSAIATLNPSRAAVYANVNFAMHLACLQVGTQVDGDKLLTTNPHPNSEEIIQVLNTAVQQARDLKDIRSESFALGNLGQVYELNQQLPDAIKYTDSALNLAQNINAPDIAYQWLWQLGRLRYRQENLPEAINAYKIAVDTLTSIRGDLVSLNSDIQFDFRDQVEPVYRQLVTLLLSKGEDNQNNLQAARKVIERLQLAELDNFFRDACTTVQPMSIDQVVDNSNPATAIFYPIILADRLDVIVKLPQVKNLLHYTTSKPKKEVENTLEQLRSSLEKYTPFNTELSLQVYKWIIQGAKKDLESNQIKNLVFVLDGSLRNIPMAALYDGKQYLIEKYSITLSPGLQLLETKLHRKRFQALIGGVTKSVQGFSQLPEVSQELKKISSFVNAKKLIDSNFTKSAIEKQVSADNYNVVHFATHGKFSSQQEETFILAWNSKINAKELREVLQTREQVVGRSSRVPPPIQLLVLSACQTADGDKRAALGLAGIAVRSGARSTLASLWKVDDKSTAILMGKFYEALTTIPNITKAEALRHAQVYVLQERKQPLYWAPYILVGNWL